MPPPSAQQPGEDGPDGSSLPAVSSIRARFENLGKEPQPPKAASVPVTAVSSKPPSRPISPAPKPDKLKDFKVTTQDASIATPTAPSTPVIPTKPKEKPRVPPPSSHHGGEQAPPPVPAASTRPSPPVKPQPPAGSQPPAVTIQPPQSPPKSRASTVPVGEHPALVDSVPAPTTPAKPLRPTVVTPRSTTPTPAVPAPRSPRQAKAPSPPPPRRSGEFRREKDAKPPPPPAPRREKTVATELASGHGSHGTSTPRKLVEETSPFNSPPGSPVQEEPAPQLPMRPKLPNAEIPERPRSAIGIFDPPPVHHSVAIKKGQRGPETNGHALASSNARPGPVARTQAIEPPPRPASATPPPRPPRPTNSSNVQSNADAQSSVIAGRRLSSNPTTQQLLPPTKAHARSKTMDNRSYEPSQPEPRPMQHATVGTERSAQPSAAPSKQDASPAMSYPDCSSTNRRAPFVKKGVEEISTKYDVRLFDVCGENVVTSGQLTRVWNLSDGEMIMSYAHTEGTKATAVAFKPATDPQEEGWKIWIGLSSGELMEVDVATHAITNSKGNVHSRREVVKIYRHYNELWTLDELGTLLVWGPDETGVPNVSGNPHQSYKLPRDHTFSMVVGSELWHATGKEIRVFAPTTDGRTQFQVLIRPLVSDGAGDVSSGTQVKTQPGKVFFGHSDGKVSIYSTKDYSQLGVLSISTWKMNALAGVGNRIWVGYNSGRICVYDIGETPWTVLKDWPAHAPQNPVVGIKSDSASAFKLDRIQVISLGADNKIKAWDGLLEDDWIEDEMKSKDTEYCDFDELSAMVFTWNAGASTPSSLRYSHEDGNFFPNLFRSSGAPDILVFGFQELVDLEDKAATAKRFLKVKKKEGSDQEKMSHQYRDWRDFLIRTLDDCMPPDDMYHLLHTAPLVGLFTCIFVKSSLRDRIRHVNGAEVKRGMGGLHGNKGATVVRFRIDDSSLCFVNCHLAAGQSQANARHTDVQEILDASLFPAERDAAVRIDSFAGGGDGSLVVDHELCILNGDLNYRIDTMSRDTVVGAVKQNNLAKLLERDQLLVARRRYPTFRLRAFEELPITFAPTYKYDVGTDRYDTSEKKRSPAWCDRLLFRGRGRVQQLDYRRHEVYVSDHRPVTGNFRLWVKSVKPKERAKAWMESQQSFEAVRERETADEKVHYLMRVCGFDEATSKQLIKDTTSRKLRRTPSTIGEGP